MEITWLRRPTFMVMGTITLLHPDNQSPNTFKEIWREFESHHEHVLPISLDHAFYGVRFPAENNGDIEYLAGMAVKKAFTTPAGLLVREVTSARYAIFRCLPGHIEETYNSLRKEWKALRPAIPDPEAPSFEQYPPRGAADPYVLIHIPVID